VKVGITMVGITMEGIVKPGGFVEVVAPRAVVVVVRGVLVGDGDAGTADDVMVVDAPVGV